MHELVAVNQCYTNNNQGLLLSFLRWNHNGDYFARIGEDTISIYETPVGIHLLFGDICENLTNLIEIKINVQYNFFFCKS